MRFLILLFHPEKARFYCKLSVNLVILIVELKYVVKDLAFY